ncbi:pathogenesis-related thaumatin superfamily protein [Striga asiatica]|uniref:Pathogenesis-related thaumatin superfamily protein n=1 Tax=Striga asiatica TaxID=4170 RepID=A0A5A7P1D8_STRAF|nr:pathogenesis-related thaumatin superfamily protein [Striga asiatica]
MRVNKMGRLSLQILFLIFANSLMAGVNSSKFTFVNNCPYTVWPGLLSNAGIASLPTTGFSLNSGESRGIDAPAGWGGRMWGRTNCTMSPDGKFTCGTGDCGSGTVDCGGAGAAPPATLAEFTLDGADGADGKDFFDVSLVDGYNLPMLVVPQGGSGANCTSTGCAADLTGGACPADLRVEGGVACMSACDRFGREEYCCSGAYDSPAICKPSEYSKAFKRACPSAYSYAFDDASSTFTCTGADYTITFCPAPNTSKKSSGVPIPGSGGGDSSSNLPFDGNMVYEGAYETSSASIPTRARVLAGAISFTAAAWLLGLHRLF